MASLAPSATDLADHVRSELASPATTTTQTLNVLRAILGLDLQSVPSDRPSAHSGIKGTARRPLPKARPTAKPTKRSQTQPFPIYESAPAAPKPLELKERRRFATETVNTTLKSLNNAAKTKQQQNSGPPTKVSATTRREPRPLKDGSSNSKIKVCRATKTEEDGVSYSTTAQCANAALDCLRNFSEQKDGASTALPDSENGGLVLLEKYITLELLDEAEYQSVRLCEQYRKYRQSMKSEKTGPDLFSRMRMASETTARMHKFAISLQSQLLRLAILKDVDCMRQGCAESVRPELEGSPAWLTLHGHKLGFSDAETTGNQLRTLSLALSKLHATAGNSKTASTTLALEGLQLAATALEIKCISWKYLAHQPDFQTELWTPVSKLVQKTVSSVKDPTKVQATAEQCIARIRQCLLQHGFTSEIPLSLRRYCNKDDESSQHSDDATRLEKQLAKLTRDDPQRLLPCLRIGLARMQDWKECTEAAIEYLQQCTEFMATIEVSTQDMTALLIALARLRNAVASAITELSSLQKKDAGTDSLYELQIVSIRFVLGLLSFCYKSDKSASATAPSPTSLKPKSNTVLTYAKVIQTVLTLEKLSITRSVAMEDEMHNALEECVAFAKSLRDRFSTADLVAEVSTFLDDLPVSVSRAFWSRYLQYMEQCRPIALKSDVLLRSIKLVQNCSLEARISAAIGLKYEKLSLLWIEEKSFSKAQLSLGSALGFAIEQGSLKHAVETSLEQVTGLTCPETKSASGTLVQLLSSYTTLALEYDVPNCKGTWFFDLDGLEDIERALLLETQILAALDRHATLIKPGQLKSALLLWEQLCSEPRYYVYQLRAISQLLHLLGKCRNLDAADILCTLPALQDPICKPVPKNAYLAQPGYLIQTQVSIQWSFASGSMNEEQLASLSTRMQGIIADFTSKQMLHVISNLHILLANLEALADYAGVLGAPQAQLKAAQMCVQLIDHQGTSFKEKTFGWLLAIARARLELDQTMEAGKVLAAAEKLVQNRAPDSLRWQLAYAEYHLSIGNFHQSKELLQTCHEVFDAAVVSTSRDKLEKQTSLCRALYVASRLAFKQGHLASATRFSRQAAKASSSLWSAVEKTLSLSNSPELSGNDSSLQILTHDLSNMSLVDAKSQQCSIDPRGAKYWTPLGVHRSVLRHAARLAAHNGSYQDALFMAQQAAKIAARTGGVTLQHCTNSELALIYASAQEKDLAVSLISQDSVALQHREAAINFAEAHLMIGDGEQAQICIKAAKPAVAPAKTVGEVPSRREPVSTKRGRAAASKAPAKKTNRAPASQVQDAGSPPSTSKTTITVKELDSRFNALMDDMHVIGIVEEQHSLSADLSTLTPTEILSRALVFVHYAMKHFAADPANNAIAETALALPVKYRATRKSRQMSLLLESPIKTQRQPSTVIANTGDGLLHQAYDWLRTIEDNSLSALPSAKVELLHKALSQIVLLSTALSRPLSYSPLNVVLQSLRPKDAMRTRERYAIEAETETATREQVQLWPVSGEPSMPHEESIDLMQALPSSWTVLSIGLSSDSKEMLLSKIIAGRTPFLMRVPLERPGVDSDEPCEFTLQYAKEELRDIVSKANESSHDSRGQGDRKARHAWYADREHLDKRMELLLANMENIWLGGFRGLLSPHSPDEALLARFGQSLVLTLEKHLPSRQKKAKPKDKVDLHAHILELFASVTFEESSSDFEDSITDLLYFVVDILQFNGEPNAMDEIDFDAMLLDTIDALRGYHSAVESSPTRHMILVIDKELQAFPWESLPCLRGRPVSRMPSLGAIKAQLDQQRSEARSIPRSGAYILNPSGDLANTQATFEPLLSQLPFESITRPPTEPEFERLLCDSSLLLYFGHGGGTQYIRGRTIRKLPRCAVTWLMGCSSAKLTECGNFESYGVPWHYMHAGSKAVVGTLWDVTDRDIDRFAVKGLGDWGLFDVSGVEEKFWGAGKSNGGGKGKAKAQAKPTSRRSEAPVPLDVAVAGAREACLLRYLNGAAPVIYGVPVMLE